MTNNSPYDMNDEVLISSLANGDTQAIRYMYKTFYPTVEKMVFKMNGSMDDAYDTFQDSMTILFEKAKAEDLQLTCRLSTYLTSIAKHVWLKKLASKKRQSVSILYDNLEESIQVDDDVNRFFEFEANVSALTRCFEQIGEPCKSILQAFYVQNKSMQEIAITHGYTNPENAKTQKYKCLNRMRKLFFSEPKKIENERIY